MPSVELATAYINLVSSARDMGRTIETQLGAAGDKGGKIAGDKAGMSLTSRLGGYLKKSSIGLGLAAGGLLAKGLIDAFSQSDATTKFKQSLNFAGLLQPEIEQATKITQKYADETVYDLTTIQNTAAQLAANGVKNFTDLTEAAGNLNAVAGGNADTFRSVAMVLTQTVGAGKLTTENWNQLADAIPGASGVLQKALLKNKAYTGDFRDAMAKGEITAKEFNKALLEVGNKPIAVQAAKSTATFEGSMGNLMATITGGATKLINQVKPQLTGFITGVSDVFGRGFTIVGKFVEVIGGLPGPIKAAGLALAAWKVADKIGLVGRLSSAFSGVGSAVSGLRGAFSRIGDDAALAGVSKMRAGFGLIGSAAKSAGSKVMAAFGGPWGLAIAAAPAAIDLLGKAFADAKPKVTDFSGAIDDNTGALRDNAGAATAKALQEAFNPKMLKAYGLTLGDVTRAVMQGGDAYAYAKKKIDDYQVAHQREDLAIRQGDKDLGQLKSSRQQYIDTVSAGKAVLEASTDAQKNSNSAVSAAKSVQNNYVQQLLVRHSLSGKVTAAQAKEKEAYYDTADAQQSLYLKYVQGQRASDEASKAAHTLAGKLQNVAKAEQEAHDKAHNLIDAASQLEAEMDRLSGRTPKVSDATRAWNGAMQDAIDSAKDADGNVRMLGKGILQASGEIKTGTRAGAQLYDTVTGLAKAARDQALAQAEATGKVHGQRAAEKALSRSLTQSRNQFVKNAHQMGLTAEQAKKLANRYFGIPKKVTTVIKGKFDDVTNKLQRIADRTVHVKVQGRYIGTTGLPTKSFGVAMGFAAKGTWVTGGIPGRDSVPYMLMPGEAIIPASTAAVNKPIVDALLAGRNLSSAGAVAPVASPVSVRSGDVQVRVFIGDQELRGMVRTEIVQDNGRQGRALLGAR